MVDNTEKHEAGKRYLTDKIVSLPNISKEDLSWNQTNTDGYELIVTKGDKRIIYEVDAMDLIDFQRRWQLDGYANDIAREFS